MTSEEPQIPRTLFFGPTSSSFGGAERRYARLYGHLRDQGAPVFLLTTEDGLQSLLSLDIVNHDDPNVFVAPSPPNKAAPTRLFYKARYLLALRRVLQTHQIDHMHLMGTPKPYHLTILSAKPRLVTFSVALFGYVTCYKKNNSSIRNKIIAFVLRRADFCDCLSSTITDAIRTFLPEHEHYKLYTAPCSFTDYPDQKLPSKDIDICMAGRFLPIKGFDLAIDALRIIEHQHPELQLTVHFCGWGPLEQHLRHRCSHLQNTRVHIYHTDDATSTMARAKLFLSLQDENYPSQSLLEAMACECCIVATDTGETYKIVDETIGRRVEPEAHTLANGITNLMIEPDLLHTLGRAASQKARTEHTVERFSDFFVNCLQNKIDLHSTR